jgi:hypothetical protein
VEQYKINSEYTMNARLWDTVGESLRQVSYPNTDVFVIAMNKSVPVTFDAVKEWYEEIKPHIVNNAVILMGLQWDLPKSEDWFDQGDAEGIAITSEQLTVLAEQLNIGIVVDALIQSCNDVMDVFNTVLSSVVTLHTQSNALYDPLTKNVVPQLQNILDEVKIFNKRRRTALSMTFSKKKSLFNLIASESESLPSIDSDNDDSSHVKLNLEVTQAIDLISMDRNGLSDPYFIVYLNGQKLYKSVVVDETLNPFWHAKIAERIPAKNSNGIYKMIIEVWDKDKLSADDFIGKIKFVVDFKIQDKHEKKMGLVPLSGPTEKSGGQIMLGFTLRL